MKVLLILCLFVIYVIFTNKFTYARLDLTPGIENNKPSVGFCIGDACPSNENGHQGQSDDPNAVNDVPLLDIPDCQAHNESHFTTIEDKTDCHMFYTCVNGTLDHLECPENLAYNPHIHLCVHEDHVKGCKTKEVECGKDGLMADPSDCTKYINCVYGFPHRFQCSQGTSFDKLSGHCRISSDCDGIIGNESNQSVGNKTKNYTSNLHILK